VFLLLILVSIKEIIHNESIKIELFL